MSIKLVKVFFFFVLLVCKRSVSQHHVCLKAYDLGDKIQMNCTVDLLNNHVTFKNPDGKDFGRCEAPYLQQCDSEQMSQDTAMHTTTLLLNKSMDIYGTWTCNHGTRIGSDSYTIQKPEALTCCLLRTHWKAISVTFTTLFVISHVVYIVLIVCFVRRRSQDKKTRSTKNTDKEPLLDRSDDHTIGFCKGCTLASVCAICSSCENIFCEICCTTHKRTNPTHKVCQIDHVVLSNSDVDCKQCNNETAKSVCINCVHEMCHACRQKHLEMYNSHKIKTLVSTHKTEKETKHLYLPYIQKQYEIKIENTENNALPKICGVCFIGNGRIVISEYNSKAIKIFRKDYLLFEHDLGQEPKGMVRTKGNSIAITYPFERQIIQYEIGDETVKLCKTFELPDKPFSIAYNQNYFAVEMGEGNDGVIVILDSEGEIVHTISNKGGFAYFTSNTIRLALDMENKKVFVTALSKKAVSCVNFNGEIQWSQAVPSPRGIVFVENIRSKKNIIIASKRWNLIFLTNSNNGKNYIMMSGTVQGPQYIDYNLKEKLLCVQIENGNILVFEVDIYEIGKTFEE